ncbi:hypothetical protein VLK31_28225 [Variovorax sp. H27-G14]|uniref:hypothetical protein n=1 Tax=Variovorax sp. H27-G14 TaxID=3111914 RepID=UPI0038FC723F
MATKQQPTSTVPNGKGEEVTISDDKLNTAEDPKTANGDTVRKENGISASATAEQILANGGKDTTDHTLKSTQHPDVPAVPDQAAAQASAKSKKVTGRVLVAITLGAQRWEPNDIIEDVPESLVGDSVDAHEDAVAYAREQGFLVKAYAPE